MNYSKKSLKILEAAKELFAKKGFSAVFSKEIAESAGVNEVTLFRNFGTKTELFKKVLEYYYFLPDFEETVKSDIKDKKIFLKLVAQFIRNVLTKNIDILMIEIKENISSGIMRYYPEKLMNTIAEYLIKNEKYDNKRACKFAELFLGSVFGLFMMNHYTGKSGEFDEKVDLLIESLN